MLRAICRRCFSTRYIPGNLPLYKYVYDPKLKFSPRAVYTNPTELDKLPRPEIKPKSFSDYVACLLVKAFELPFEDLNTTFSRGGDRMEGQVCRRMVLFESVAVVPGKVIADRLHFLSIRRRIDYSDRIIPLAQEAENEKVHLFTFLTMCKPSRLTKIQAVLYLYIYRLVFGTLYRLHNRTAHKLVAYVELEAVNSYTKILRAMDGGPLEHWNRLPAPQIAKDYWKLPKDATMKDVVLSIRADEALHRETNNYLADLRLEEENEFDKLIEEGWARDKQIESEGKKAKVADKPGEKGERKDKGGS